MKTGTYVFWIFHHILIYFEMTFLKKWFFEKWNISTNDLANQDNFINSWLGSPHHSFIKLFWFASSFVVIFHFKKTTFSEIVHLILYRSKKINNGYIFFSDKTTCAFLCLKKQAECHAYQTNYKDGTNLIGNYNKENCMLYKFSTGVFSECNSK